MENNQSISTNWYMGWYESEISSDYKKAISLRSYMTSDFYWPSEDEKIYGVALLKNNRSEGEFIEYEY
jgi:hypothetical protein